MTDQRQRDRQRDLAEILRQQAEKLRSEAKGYPDPGGNRDRYIEGMAAGIDMALDFLELDKERAA